MKLVLIILLTICIGRNYSTSLTRQTGLDSKDKITQISFHLEHSLRIPNYKVDIEMSKRFNGVFLHVSSSPMPGHSGWDNTRIDTTYKINEVVFDKVLSSIRLISPKDLQSAGVSGDDGTSCEIRFGDYQNYISYVIWTPNYNTKERKTEDFLNACKQFIVAAHLDPKKIL
jgi:hypothetical protein